MCRSVSKDDHTILYRGPDGPSKSPGKNRRASPIEAHRNIDKIYKDPESGAPGVRGGPRGPRNTLGGRPR